MPKLPESSMDLSEIMKLANSDAGRQLTALMQQRSSRQLDHAMEQASAGDYGLLQQTVREFLASPEARALADQLRR